MIDDHDFEDEETAEIADEEAAWEAAPLDPDDQDDLDPELVEAYLDALEKDD